ncbi:hypothetical protein MJ1_0371 [Nanobdella aerobiophila]|uniref:DUF1641 domain-containing protein n=1 Tax=Nanobdella aerobiophila TaxID=2586965 RepID=A0A915WSP4_9ARCH|nr:DUF1641 domain-containing protein [Nanobdella aerobiophila]BBL45535.1 hypothetical protein MJ1_0371 [Nanobdella aerobiophila]
MVELSDEELKSLKKFIELLNIAENKYGLISLLEGILEDEKAVGKLLSHITSDEALSIISEKENMLKIIASIGDGLEEQNKVKINGLMSIWKATHDKDIQKGLSLVFTILKKLGSKF